MLGSSSCVLLWIKKPGGLIEFPIFDYDLEGAYKGKISHWVAIKYGYTSPTEQDVAQQILS